MLFLNTASLSHREMSDEGNFFSNPNKAAYLLTGTCNQVYLHLTFLIGSGLNLL